MLKLLFLTTLVLVSGGAVPNGTTSIQSTSPNSVCYRDVGCFRLDGPMAQTGVLPQTPAFVRTRFYAYTSNSIHRHRELQPNNIKSFEFLDETKRIVFLIHGFYQSSADETLQKLKKSLLQHTSDVGTVIMVDWQRGAHVGIALGGNFPWEFWTYKYACSNTQLVGRQITFLVERLRVHGKTFPAKVYLIGFSLGAQVAGFAGKRSSRYGWKYSRITGLDAAKPLFEGYSGSHLTRSDADFVDSIHTNGGLMGFSSAFAKVDFIANGGEWQPKCGIIDKYLNWACDHRASVEYFEVSIRQKEKCPLWACPTDSESCSKPDTLLGYYADEHSAVSGKRFVSTKSSPPECLLHLGNSSTPNNVMD